MKQRLCHALSCACVCLCVPFVYPRSLFQKLKYNKENNLYYHFNVHVYVLYASHHCKAKSENQKNKKKTKEEKPCMMTTTTMAGAQSLIRHTEKRYVKIYNRFVIRPYNESALCAPLPLPLPFSSFSCLPTLNFSFFLASYFCFYICMYHAVLVYVSSFPFSFTQKQPANSTHRSTGRVCVCVCVYLDRLSRQEAARTFTNKEK